MLLQGTTFCADFSVENANFTSMVNLISKDEYIKRIPTIPLISLVVLEKNTMEKREIYPEKGTILQENTVFFASFSGLNITATLKFELVQDKILISAEVRNNEKAYDVVEIVCPHLSGIFLGTTHQDDVIIYPHHAGELTKNPVREYATEKNKGFWRAGSTLCGDVYRREINYCGLASMSWMYYYDECNGLYIGSHDPRFPVTGVIAESGTEATPYMGFAFRKHHRIVEGEQYNTGVYCIAISEHDWHYGAKVYRDYIEPYLDFDHTPEFLSNQYALNQCYNFKRTGVVENRFCDIPKMFETGKAWGVNHMFIASWNRTGFDSFYPEYYPDMELGSAMEFRRGLEYVRQHGGFSTLYINARIFDLKSDFHKLVGEKMALRDEKGSMLYETYGPEHFTVNCPSDKLWKEYLIDTAEFAFKAYGCDGIYLDQLASAEPFACYCEQHSHQDIGEFNNGQVEILKELLYRMKDYNSNAYLMTENCGDIYGSYTWGNLTWNGTDYDEYFNVFKYTFPEFVQVNMVNPRSWVDNAEQKLEWFYRDMQRAILLGNILWMGITSRLTPETGVYHSLAKQYLEFRKMIQPMIENSKFLDHEMVVETSADCDATCWQQADSRYFILAGNPLQKEGAFIKLRLPKGATELHRYNLDGEESVQRIAADTITVDLTGDRLLCIIIE